MNIFYFILSLLAGSGIIIWLGKFIITKAVDVGIEKYKAELVKDIEKHKADLSRITTEHQVKFSKLHEQRAEKIKNLYDKVREMEKALRYSTTIFQGSEFSNDTDRDNAAFNQIASLIDLVDTERIYFDDSTIYRLDSLIKKSKEILRAMVKVRLYHKQYDHLLERRREVPENVLNEMDKWNEVDERIDTELKELKIDLANEFKTLLGINNN